MKYIITESQYKLLTEDFPIGLKRRLSFDSISEIIESVLFEMDLCDFYDNPGEYISMVCEVVSENIVDYFEDENKTKITPKQKDDLYFYLVDNFGSHIRKEYDNRCT